MKSQMLLCATLLTGGCASAPPQPQAPEQPKMVIWFSPEQRQNSRITDITQTVEVTPAKTDW